MSGIPAGQRRISVLAHPSFVGAVAVLAVNDHALKGLGPGWLTGKLSDVAGVFVIAVLLGLVLGRTGAAAVLTGLGFAALKLSPMVIVLAAPVLGGATRRDPTDLVALAALVPAYRAGQRATPAAEPSVLRSLLLTGSGLVAVLSITATGCEAPHIVVGLTARSDTVFARRTQTDYTADRPATLTTWARSDDGGRTWRAARPPAAPSRPNRGPVCLRDGTCVRAIPGRRVEERLGGGPWHTAFDFSSEDERRMALDAACGRDPHDEFRGVAVVDVGGRQHVIVTLGSQGVLHRTPSGAWERRPVGDSRPLSTTGPSWLAGLRFSPLLLVAMAPALWWLGRRHGTRDRGRRAGVVAAVGGGTVVTVGGILAFMFDYYAIDGPLMAAAAAALFATSLVIAVRDSPRDRAQPEPQPGQVP